MPFSADLLLNPPEGLFVHRARLWFDDLDGLWMLHHSRYLAYAERAQQAMFDELMGAKTFDPPSWPDVYVVVKNANFDYLRPLDNVMDFLVSVRVKRLREAGLTTQFGFHSADGKLLYAKGLRTVCKLSLQTKQPTGWTPRFREIYERWAELGKTLPELP